jgi:xanthine dehydrogenase YagR molybdenum-binding subunit
MRAPAEVPYMFALESAINERAYELKMDPIELRRVNDTMKEPIDRKPYTSRSLMASRPDLFTARNISKAKSRRHSRSAAGRVFENRLFMNTPVSRAKATLRQT